MSNKIRAKKGKKNKIVILGAGGVASVTAHKCAMLPEIFHDIVLASRTKSKCDRIARSIKEKTFREIKTVGHTVGHDDTLGLLRKIKPDVLINVADPYIDLDAMDFCLEAGVNYIDTANWEPEDGSSVSPETGALLRYEEQWDRKEAFRNKGLIAIIGAGYDPGVTQANVAYALKHYFREIHNLHILDCNAGNHGLPFATNFNPEINIREVEAKGMYWENGLWKKTESIINPWGERQNFRQHFEFIGAGEDGKPAIAELFLLYHEELQSLVRHIPGLQLATFGMTFGKEYLTHLRSFKNGGMTRIDPVVAPDVHGNLVEIVPIQLLKVLLPDPASLASRYCGKTHIACYMEGIGKDGNPLRYYIFNVCDFKETYREVGSQAISYTAGVPPMIAAKLILEGKWSGAGVFNVEELDPDPFMYGLNQFGLGWQELFNGQAPHFNWNELKLAA